MVRRSKEELLADLKRNRRNRELSEVQDLLVAFGFVVRKARKEQGGVWSRGSRTITLPRPHSGRNTLLPAYVSRVILEIELAEEEAKEDEAKEDEGVN